MVKIKFLIFFSMVLVLFLMGCGSNEPTSGVGRMKCYFGKEKCESVSVEGNVITADFKYGWKKNEVYIHSIESECEIKEVLTGVANNWGYTEVNHIVLECPQEMMYKMSEDNPINVEFTESFVDSRFGGEVRKTSMNLTFYD